MDVITNNDILIQETSGCSNGKYTCLNGECISLDWLCDGETDCSQGEDEKGCCTDNCNYLGQVTCLGDEILECNYYGSTCLDWFTIDHCSDFGKYCEDGTCKSEEPSCPSGDFQCLDYNCIPLKWVCNGAENCLGGEDEQGCAPSCIDECTNWDYVCVGSTGVKHCEFSPKGCFQWSEVYICPSGEYCKDDGCIPKPTDPDASP